MTIAPTLAGRIPRTGDIRPFAEEDIPRVASLHRTVFRPEVDPQGLAARYHAYFTRVFLHNPSRNAALPSLVYQEPDGRIVGFLGVAPRRMTLNGQRFQAAISSQFVVDPSCHTGLVAVRLAKAFLDGPQDLSLSDEANDVTRRIWEGLGGTTSMLYSLHWTRLLRPAQYLSALLRRRRALRPLAAMTGPLSRVADVLAMRTAASPLRIPLPRGAAADLDVETFLAGLPEMAGAGSLRVEYDDRSAHWLLHSARRRAREGALHAAAIGDGKKVLGWYVYHLDRDRVAEVLQVAGTRSSIHDVLDHLFHHAGRQKAVAVAGRLEPRFLQALSDKQCLFHRRGPWVLVGGRRPELVRCLQGEQAFLSRLDGEWCLGF